MVTLEHDACGRVVRLCARVSARRLGFLNGTRRTACCGGWPAGAMAMTPLAGGISRKAAAGARCFSGTATSWRARAILTGSMSLIAFVPWPVVRRARCFTSSTTILARPGRCSPRAVPWRGRSITTPGARCGMSVRGPWSAAITGSRRCP